jgi:predicted kinase
MRHTLVFNKHNIENQITDYKMNRDIIKRTWNTESIQEKSKTPFRQVYNSGHSQGQKHEYVVDNSNYVQYLKQRAIRDNYVR